MKGELCRPESLELRLELRAALSSEPELGIELQPPELNSKLGARALTRAQARAQARAQSWAQLRTEPELRIELRPPELNSELGARAQGQATPDPIIERAIAATQRARVSMVFSIKVLQEDRTSTDNKRLFVQILDEPHPHRLEYHVNVKGSVVQTGAGAIKKQRSVAYTAITTTITVVTYQV
ncbi:hypothetical protein V491_00452 [Pseudogymnoascus sp. VKM F-3775]|nr:hypothetical protein V491_00452 [Pseudogymnoascus sp. VKM F-3775]